MLASALLVVLHAAPIAEVWPYAGKRLPTGEVEYAYDLTGVKAKGGTPDANSTHGEEKVKDFLKGLPKEAKVLLKPGAALSLGMGRGAEPVPLVNALSSLSDAKVLSNNPLAKTPGALMRPALHPEEPKVLLSAEAAMWRVRRLFEGAEAAVVLDSEKVHAALWNKLAERAIARLKTANGDAREGAVALAGRLVAAGACLDSAKVPASAKASAEVAAAAEAELTAARADADLAVPPGLYGWSKELTCARIRTRMLSRPFPQSRAGVAAALTLLGLLSADPKLEASWNALRARRDALTGGPEKEPLLDYRERSKGNVEDAMENMAAFIDALGERLPQVPPPLEAAATPFARFLAELEPASRASAIEELLAAAQDGRLAFPAKETSPVLPQYEAALAGLVEEGKRVQLDAAWRDRRAAGFTALAGGHRDSADEGRDLSESADERADLKIRLLVPPSLEVEPAVRVYSAAADGLSRLADAMAKLQLPGLAAVQGEGGRSGEPIGAEAKRLAGVLRGLAKLSADEPPQAGDADLAAARKFIAGWRTDPAFGKDVREARALAVNQGSKRLHAAIIGVARRELLVGFPGAISASVSVPGPFETAPAEQRYLVPALITRGALGSATAQPIDRLNLRALCEVARRQPNEIEAALVDAMKTR